MPNTLLFLGFLLRGAIEKRVGEMFLNLIKMKKLSFENFNEAIFKPMSVSEISKIKGGVATFSWSTSRISEPGGDQGHEDAPSYDFDL